MAPRNAERVQGDDLLLFTIVIPNSASAPKTLTTLLGTGMTDQRKKMLCGFEIREHANPFYVCRNSNNTAPRITVDAYDPWSPPVVGARTIDNSYVRAGTGKATTAAVFVAYLGDYE